MTEYDAVESDRWTGWIMFAGVIMIIAGVLQGTYGLIALFNDNWVVWGNRGTALLDLTQWGVVHVVVAAILILSGIAVMTGNFLARLVGVVVATVAAVVNFWFIPVYPLWSITVVVLSIVVIWALVVHGNVDRRTV